MSGSRVFVAHELVDTLLQPFFLDWSIVNSAEFLQDFSDCCFFGRVDAFRRSTRNEPTTCALFHLFQEIGFGMPHLFEVVVESKPELGGVAVLEGAEEEVVLAHGKLEGVGVEHVGAADSPDLLNGFGVDAGEGDRSERVPPVIAEVHHYSDCRHALSS